MRPDSYRKWALFYLLTYLHCIIIIIIIKLCLYTECKMKLLPRYMGILKHHLVNKLETKQCTSVLFEILKSLFASQQAVRTVHLSSVVRCWRGSVVRTSVFGWQTVPDLYIVLQ